MNRAMLEQLYNERSAAKRDAETLSELLLNSSDEDNWNAGVEHGKALGIRDAVCEKAEMLDDLIDLYWAGHGGDHES